MCTDTGAKCARMKPSFYSQPFIVFPSQFGHTGAEFHGGGNKGLRNRLSVRELHARLPLERKKAQKQDPRVLAKQSANGIYSIEPVSLQHRLLSVLEESRETPIINDLQLLSQLLQQLHTQSHKHTLVLYADNTRLTATKANNRLLSLHNEHPNVLTVTHILVQLRPAFSNRLAQSVS